MYKAADITKLLAAFVCVSSCKLMIDEKRMLLVCHFLPPIYRKMQ